MAEISQELDESPLSDKQRRGLPDSAFAIPKRRKYPIHDVAHARNALARVSKFGTEEEKEKVRAEVKRRYPNINKQDESHSEQDMSNPEEKREVCIANQILAASDNPKVKELAQELLRMHGQA